MKLSIYQYLALIAAIIFSSANIFSQQLRWEKVPSPVFGRVTSMTVGDSLVYVATLQGSIFVSRNEGELWELATKGLTPEPPNVPGSDTLSIPQKYPFFTDDYETIPFIAVKDAILIDAYGTKCGIEGDGGPLIFRSVNQGKTWQHVLGETKFLDEYDKKYYQERSSPFTGIRAYPNNIYFTLDSLLYIKSVQGYYMSRDYGVSWKLLPPLSVTHSTITAQICSQYNYPWVIERGDLHKRLPELKDQSGRYIQLGEHIFTTNTDGSLRLVSSPSVLPILSHKNKWFRLNGKNLEISIDKGFTWQVTATLPVQPERLVVNNTSLLLISASQNYRSSDEGKTWEEIPQSPDWLGCRVQGIGSSYLLRSTTGTVYRLKGNETFWRLSEQGLESVYYNAVVVTDSVMIVSTIPWASSFERRCYSNPDLLHFYYATYSNYENKYYPRTSNQATMYRSLNRGKTWEAVLNSPQSISYVAANNTVFASSYNAVFSTKDHGKTWSKVFDRGGWIKKLKKNLFLINRNYYLSDSLNLLRTDSTGQNWVDISLRIPQKNDSSKFEPYIYVYDIAEHIDSLFLKVSGDGGFNKIYYSMNYGKNWILQGLVLGDFHIGEITKNYNFQWLRALSFLYRGYSFDSLHFVTPFFNQIVLRTFENENFPPTLYLFSEDHAGKIIRVPKADSGLAPGTFVISMTQHKDTLYAATDNGLYRAVLPKTTSVQVSHEVLQPQIELSVAPQPSSDKVRIYTTLPEAGFMELKVFSFQGECIGTLTSGRYPAGTHEFVWDVSGYPSGTYMLQLRTAKERRYAKVSVVK